MAVQASDFAARVAELDTSASYAVYCQSGHRSELALEKLTAAGFTHVVDLAGGVPAWTAEGYPLVGAP
ncbi:rhodanese-like domain-containing protein [Cellulomonas sp. WB94]|uniref:rhodanese-like domain-containing protein n=1 Tax=Cellulomonas sp. WB94 TaxID=2173174 RepID=UPI001304E77A|nr:rhodanese-like domain-containing protein [Cellulomonas sp. WB94]